MMLGLYSGPPSSSGTLLLDATAYIDNAQLSTNEHGFEALLATIRRSFSEAFSFYHQAGTLYVGLFEDGGIVWEGRLEDPTLYADEQGSGLGVQALGAWRALTDDRYTALWSSTSVAEYRPFTTTDFGSATAVYPDRYTFDTQNRLYIAPQKNATLGNTTNIKPGMLGFLLPDQSTRDIIGAQFSFTYTMPAANWRVAFQTRNADFTGIANPWLVTTAGAGSASGAVHVTFAACRIVDAFVDFNAADAVYPGETGANFLRITNLRVVSSSANRVNTTLSANRNVGTNVTATVGSTAGMYVGMSLVMNSAGNPSEMVTVLSIGSSTQFNATFANNYTSGQAVQGFRILADEIAEDIVAQVSALNSDQLSSSTSLIQSPGLDLTDEGYEDAIPADVLTHLVELGDNQTPPRQWEVGVYENRVLHFRPRGSAARAWYVDATDLQIARSLEDLSNSVYATYQDSNSSTQRTANSTDSTSIARYGITRRSNVAADTTSAVQAGVQRGAQLDDHKDPLPRATVVFPAVYDASGAWYPMWMVRSGDTVTIRNLPPSTSSSVDRIRTFRISHTAYDLMARTLAIELEVPPPRLATLLARRAEGIRTSFGRK